VVAFIDWWTNKPRPLTNPHPTLVNYIGSGFTKMRLLQEAVTMELPQLQKEAGLQPLLSDNQVKVKMYDVRDNSSVLRKE
jgi:hypothetical protein